MINLFIVLIMGHALADFSWQTDRMAFGKSRNSPLPKWYNRRLHGLFPCMWPYWLSSHALINGLIVFIITQSMVMGLFESVTHFVIDFGKCERWYGLHIDQFLHVIVKVIITACIYYRIFV